MKVEYEDIIFQGRVFFRLSPEVPVSQLIGTTPNVADGSFFLSHSAATNVTDFLGGIDGGMIRILGNGNTTIVNGTTIKTNTGANKVLAADKIYTFCHYNSVWYEDA